MPRDVNGNYTLPAGNPVVSGTPISSAVQNATTSDLATALTDSLSRSGKGGMLVPLLFADGTAAAPSITFTAEPTTGIFRSGPAEFAITVTGAKRFVVADDGCYSENPYYEWNGTIFVPLLNATDDYTIQGEWDFAKPVTLAYDAVNFLGSLIAAGKGAVLGHNDPAQSSGLVRIVSVAPGVSDGKPGDVWLVV